MICFDTALIGLHDVRCAFIYVMHMAHLKDLRAGV